MKTRNLIAGIALAAVGAGGLACSPAEGHDRTARNTLVIGIDVSGSFRTKSRYDNAIDFASYYIYAHLNGLGGLRQPSALFVGSIGGEKPDEIKSFQPIHTFQGRSVEDIAAYLREQYPIKDGLTDFNPFFQRVSTLVQRQGLVLAPLEVVVLSDGLPDVGGPAGSGRYAKIDVSPLEFLARSVTVRVLYPEPTIAGEWERRVERRRVRMWTVDDEVMKTWPAQLRADVPPEAQDDLWKWISDNVDFRVRSRGIM